MEMNQETAKQQLEMINEIKTQTKRVVAAEITCKYLILWGLALILGYLVAHVYYSKTSQWLIDFCGRGDEGTIWFVIMGVFGIINYVITKKDLKSGAVRPTDSSRSPKQMFWFWMVLGIYAFIALSVLAPSKGIQVNAFMIVTGMFSYVIMGIWGGEKILIWLGIIITANTLIGYFILPNYYYSIWMAVMAGGVMASAGLFGKIFWAVKS
ncbi:MAG: hypothetical protein KAS96_11630 [Planctomycetes bacterium]|nr:hypothetical protein [Planctomycetota bacterium]